MTGDGNFMDKAIISELCVCQHVDTCKQMIDLLNNKKYTEASVLLSNILNDWKLPR